MGGRRVFGVVDDDHLTCVRIRNNGETPLNSVDTIKKHVLHTLYSLSA